MKIRALGFTTTPTTSRARRGAMAYVMLISLIFFMVLFLLLMDLSRNTVERVEIQDAADSAAYSSGLWMARGMNAVTATNHHLGEMLSLVVLHKAIAGENVDGRELDAADRRIADSLDRAFPMLAELAASVGGLTVTYPDVAERLRAAETVGEGKLRLKQAVAIIYASQYAASFLPYGGTAIIQSLNLVEAWVWVEWQALDAMERIARGMVGARNLVADVLMPAARRYEDKVVRDVPVLAAETARGLAEENHTIGAVYPAHPELPIEPEAFDADDSDHARSMAKTQIVRASFPWVNHHRRPILKNTSWMFVSGASRLYRKWTNHDVTERARAFYLEHRAPLYVMKESRPPLKGFETWTEDPRDADRLFSVVGMSSRPAQRPFGAPVLKTENEAGLVAYAQAMVYNANPQTPSTEMGRLQAEVGWDTLNWQAPIEKSHAYEFPEGNDEEPGPPLIQVNWQAKLVPVTPYLDVAAGAAPAPFGSILRRVVPVPHSLRTH